MSDLLAPAAMSVPSITRRWRDKGESQGRGRGKKGMNDDPPPQGEQFFNLSSGLLHPRGRDTRATLRTTLRAFAPQWRKQFFIFQLSSFLFPLPLRHSSSNSPIT